MHPTYATSSRYVTGGPILLTHALTRHCNSWCRICDIWRSSPKGAEMTTGQVEATLDDVWAQNFAFVALAPP